MKLIKLIKTFFFGEAATGEPIIAKTPTCHTCYPCKEGEVGFNEWARSINVSSGYIKHK